MKFYLVFAGSCTIGFPSYERAHRTLKSVIKAISKMSKAIDLSEYPAQVWRLNKAGWTITN